MNSRKPLIKAPKAKIEESNKRILVIGDPGFTTYVKVHFDFSLDDEILYLPKGIIDAVGGSVFNIAVPLKVWGVPVSVLGNIGDDFFSSEIERAMMYYSIDGMLLKNYKQPIRSVILIKPDGDKIIFHEPSAANEVLIKYGDIAPLLKEAGLIHLCPFKWVRDLILTALTEHPEDLRAVIGTDLHTNFDINGYHAPFIAASDIVFFSAKGIEDVEKMAREIASRGPKIVVATAGADGCFLFDTQRQHFSHFPALNPEHKIIDTTGAGDAFAAGFYFAYIHGLPLQKCVLIAQYAALHNSYHIGSINPVAAEKIKALL